MCLLQLVLQLMMVLNPKLLLELEFSLLIKRFQALALTDYGAAHFLESDFFALPQSTKRVAEESRDQLSLFEG